MAIQTTTLMRQVEADLRDAFPETEFRLSVPEWSMRRGNRRTIEIFWCGDPPDAEVEAVAAKYKHHRVSLFVDRHVPCERCGEATHHTTIGVRAFCVICEPDLWGCRSEEDRVRAVQRLRAEAAAMGAD
jgi:hypothetical protein